MKLDLDTDELATIEGALSVAIERCRDDVANALKGAQSQHNAMAERAGYKRLARLYRKRSERCQALLDRIRTPDLSEEASSS